MEVVKRLEEFHKNLLVYDEDDLVGDNVVYIANDGGV